MFRETDAPLLLVNVAASANGGRLDQLPDNVVRFLVIGPRQAASMCSVFFYSPLGREHQGSSRCRSQFGKLCEAAICYSGNLSDSSWNRNTPGLRPEVWRLSCAIRARMCSASRTWVGMPAGARKLVQALKDEIGLPITSILMTLLVSPGQRVAAV